MSKEQQDWIAILEAAWAEPSGFLYKVRQGKYDPIEGRDFITKLSEIKLSGNEPVPRRLVSLLWYVPYFLSWQKQRVAKKGGDVADYEQFTTQVQNILEDILGVP